MDKLERRLLAQVAALPAGQKLPMSRIARELGCSSSVAISGVAALVMSGALDEATMRPPVAARKEARDRYAPTDTINGRQLIAELQPFLDATQMPPTTLTKRAIGDPGAWGRWKTGKAVRLTTAARVRAFVAAHASRAASDSNLIDETPGGRDSAVGQAAPVPGAGDQAGATVARCNPVALADTGPEGEAPGEAERPTGQELYDEILRFTASDDGLTLRQFAELLGRSVAGIANMAKANRPKTETIDRVRAIIAGDRSPFVPTGDKAAPRVDGAAAAARLEELRAAAQEGATRRLPGETLADAVKREAEEQGERRSNARESKGARTLETNRERFARLGAEVEREEQEAAAIEREALRERELDELVSPSSVLRRAQRDWPAQCEKVKAIAVELGVSLGEAWRRVIAAGVDCMDEDAADERCGAAVQRGHA